MTQGIIQRVFDTYIKCAKESYHHSVDEERQTGIVHKSHLGYKDLEQLKTELIAEIEKACAEYVFPFCTDCNDAMVHDLQERLLGKKEQQAERNIKDDGWNI